MTPYTPLHPDDVTILVLDYDVIIFYDVNPLGYCDVTVSLCPCWRTGLSLLLSDNVLLLLFKYFPEIKLKKNHATGNKRGRTRATKISIGKIKQG